MSGGRWGAVRSVALQVTSIGTTAILARILSEEDFGVVAITVLVLTMFDLITRVGLGASLIRREELTTAIQSTFFWTSLMLGLASAALAIATSGPVAALAGSVEAAPLVALAAVTLPLNLAAQVPFGLLTRKFRFRTLAGIDIAGALTHAVIAISLALFGLGALAVVIGQVARSGVILVGTLAASGFRPRFTYSRRIVVEDLSFNLGWLGSDLLTYANKNADYWFVGNRFGTAPLGIYYVAYVIPTLLRRRVTAIGHEVLYPVIARIQGDSRRVVAAYLRVAKLAAFVLVPAMLGLSATADLAIAIGFGSDWAEAVEPLRIFALGAAVTSTTSVASPIFPALGMPSVLVVSGFAALATLALGLSFSLSGGTLTMVAAAVLAAAIVDAVVVLNRLKAILGLPYAKFASAMAPYVVSSIVMVVLVVAVKSWVSLSLGVVLTAVVSAVTGLLAYLLMGRLFFWGDFKERFAAFRELLGLSRR